MLRRRRESRDTRNQLKVQHFSNENWSDFARGRLDSNLREAMRQHLAEGCGKCQKINALWESVAKTAAREKLYVPPDHVLRFVRGQFGLVKPLPWTTGLVRTALLVFDNLERATGVGVRSLASGPRQLIYQVGEYFLDVKMERDPNSRKLSLIGQIRDSHDPAKKMADSPVILLRGQDRLGQTTTNGFGEFQLEFDRKDNLWLAIGIQGEAGIVVPLERAVRPEFAESGRVRGSQ